MLQGKSAFDGKKPYRGETYGKDSSPDEIFLISFCRGARFW